MDLQLQSIRARLTGLVLLATTIALLVASTALLVNDLRTYRNTLTSGLQTEAQILALSTAPALEFDDRDVAERNLRSLQARPGILAAAIYRADNTLYAKYVRPDQVLPERIANYTANTPSISHGRVELAYAVTQNGERLGTIYLRARYDIVGQLRTYLGILALVIVLSGFIAILLTEKLQRSLSWPLEAMTAVARQVVQKRDYSPRVARGGAGEIGLVIAAFNNMLDEVQSRTRTLHEEIAVRRAAEEALERSNATLEDAMSALRESDQKKDEFLAILAHELRNPLAPIGHTVKLLSLSSTSESQRAWGHDLIARQVSRMALLLDDLLDISRITRGRLELKKSYTDLKCLVASAVETARPLIDARRHSLQVSLPSEPLELDVDPLRLSQALSNLLTNAAKYTDEGGRIELAIALQDDELVMSVRDNGIGIKAEALPTLFAMFSQVESAMDRSQGGLGIGLALVKGLVSLHGGNVSAESAGPGQGSTFTIRLPRRVVVPESVQPQAEGSTIAFAASAGCSVLIADDNRDAADSLAMLLQAAGHQVFVAYSGTEAWETAIFRRPQALVLDIGMPGMSGYEVARRVRQLDWGGAALLIAATGWGQLEDKERAAASGFDRHLTKPLSPDRLLEHLAAFAESIRARAGAPASAGAGISSGAV